MTKDSLARCAEKDCNQAAKFGSIWCRGHYDQHWQPKPNTPWRCQNNNCNLLNSWYEAVCGSCGASKAASVDVTPPPQLDAATEEELDNWILDLVNQGSLLPLPRGKTINADMFPEAKAALARLLIRERHRALLGVNNQDIVFIDLGDGEKQYIPVSKLREREVALEAQLEKEGV